MPQRRSHGHRIAILLTLVTLVAALAPDAPAVVAHAANSAPTRRPIVRRHAATAPTVSPLTGGWRHLVFDEPPPVAGAALAWDSADRVMFLFGGSSANGASGALWAYRPVTTTAGGPGWLRLAASGDAPGSLTGASAVWDDRDGVLLVVDGIQDGRETDGIYAYKPGRGIVGKGRGRSTRGRWFDVDPSGAPLRRAYQSAVWDGKDGVMLLFGGETGGIPHGDTWLYKPGMGGVTPGTWTQLGSHGGPEARQRAMAAWDSTDGGMILAGGAGYSGLLSDLWLLRSTKHDAFTWTRLAATTPIGPRAGGAALWDSAGKQLLLFGGQVPSPAPTATSPAPAQPSITPATPATPAQSSITTIGTITATTPPSTAPTPTTLPPTTVTPITATIPSTTTATASSAVASSVGRTGSAAETGLVHYGRWWACDCGRMANHGHCGASAGSTGRRQRRTYPTAVGAVCHATAVAGVDNTRALAPGTAALAAKASLPSINAGRLAARASSRYPTTVATPQGTYGDELWSYSAGRRGIAAGTWRLLRRGGGPLPRAASAVYDDKDHAILLFGGQSVTALDDLWSYPLAGRAAGRWALLDGGQPQARAGQAGTWDPRDGVLFIFGGYSGTRLNDLWAYKPARGAAGRWTLIPATGPSPRAEASLVWDSADGVLLLFGGADASGSLNDVWAYRPAGDGTATGRWTPLAVGATAPSGRHLHTAVWDSADHQMLVYAGESGPAVLRDLWSFHVDNLAAGRGHWQLLMAATPPAARFAQAAIWDTAHARMLVFGGVNSAGGFLDDLWAYQPHRTGAGTWTSLGSPGTPDARATTAAAWDTADKAMFVFGGTGDGSIRNDAYMYRPAGGWSTVMRANPPGRRNGATAVYDTINRGILVYGGTGATGAYGDLYQLGGIQPSSRRK